MEAGSKGNRTFWYSTQLISAQTNNKYWYYYLEIRESFSTDIYNSSNPE